jgi:hypothetical protein
MWKVIEPEQPDDILTFKASIGFLSVFVEPTLEHDNEWDIILVDADGTEHAHVKENFTRVELAQERGRELLLSALHTAIAKLERQELNPVRELRFVSVLTAGGLIIGLSPDGRVFYTPSVTEPWRPALMTLQTPA